MKQVRRLERNTPHQKYFLSDGTQVTGASTISKLGEDPGALIQWAWKMGKDGKDHRQIRDDAGDAGTIAHFMIECYLREEDWDLSEFTAEAIDRGTSVFLKWLEWWDQQNLYFVSAETQLVSERYRYGGTLDVLCRNVYDRLVLLDTKTSKDIYNSQLFQLAGYENLANENYDEIIGARAIIRFGKNEKLADMEVKWVPDITQYLEVFKAQVALHHALSKVPPSKRYYGKK